MTVLMVLMAAFGLVVPARSDAPATSPEPEAAVPFHLPPPEDGVRGLYVTGAFAASSQMDRLLDRIAATQINTIVIELKDELGFVTFRSTNPLAREVGAVRGELGDLQALVQRLHSRDLYVVGRMVAFRDHRLASRRPELALKDVSGDVWLDRQGIAWLDPSQEASWSYLIDLAVEAALAGVDEIQWDYVRFPTDGPMERLVYPQGVNRGETIAAFLAASRKALRPVGAYVSADLFGFSALTRGDMGIGHQLELLAEQVDVVSLMLYPSHFPPGAMGLADPDREPYETVLRSLKAATQRVNPQKLRPWLQSFSLRNPYGPQEVWEQILAA
ncbi:MAG TPA: putative glycoside hydrolase, partial [Limnochorda sp.]